MLDLTLLDRVFLHNTLRAWLVALVVLLGTWLALTLVKRLLVGRLARIAERTHTDVDNIAVDIIERTRPLFIAVVALIAGTMALVLPDRLQSAIRVVGVLAVMFQVGIWGNGIVGFLVARHLARHGTTGTNATTIHALGFAARFLLWVIVFLLVLDNLGVDITALVAGLGITGIAVALAVQNILGDLLAAMSILLDKPFVVGDFIIVDQTMGTIEHIGLKTTRLRALSGEQIIVSNAELLKARIRNFKRMFERRIEFLFGITYDTPIETVEKIPGIIAEIVGAQEKARLDRTHFKRFGDSALEFETIYFVTVPEYNVFMDIQQAINLELMRRFQEMGVQFAFPSRTVYLHTEREEPAAALA